MNPYASGFDRGQAEETGRPPGEPSSDRPSGSVASWTEREPTLRGAIGRATGRLLARARASWPIWTGLVLLLWAGTVAWKLEHPSPFATTVVFRISEREAGAAPETLSSRALRAYIFDLAFSHANLARVANGPSASAPARRESKRASKKESTGDPVTDLLEATSLKISENDFVEDRDDKTPPRSVRMELTFRSSVADVSWNVAHELADLIMRSERGRRERAAAQAEAIGEAARGLGAGARDASAAGQGVRPQAGSVPVTSAAIERDVESAIRQAGGARLAREALEANQSLRFELVDPGQYPGDQFRSPLGLVVSGLLALPFGLFAAALLAGAFDPRVLDARDLAAMGVVILGRVEATTRGATRV
jgi:hypothetical protein